MRFGAKSVSFAVRAALTQLNLSAHAYHRILKLARTIADLAGSEEIQFVAVQIVAVSIPYPESCSV
jgi:predicted ATPase with chaperone activity